MKKKCKILVIEPSDIIRKGIVDILNTVSCVNKIDQTNT